VNPELQTLLEIQDLRGQHRELSAGARSPALGNLEEEHFGIDVDEAREALEKKIAELEERLSAPVRGRYERLSPHRDRVVVPVINGACYGCFVSIPTATVGDPEGRKGPASCQNCGCFIYVLH